MGEQQHTVELVQGIASVALEERSGIVTRHIACVAPLQPDLKRLTLQGHGRPSQWHAQIGTGGEGAAAAIKR